MTIAAVFYNTRLALYLCFLLPELHFPPRRVDVTAPPDEDYDRQRTPPAPS
jgi:hypothetical protein